MYRGFALRMAARVQRRFEEIESVHNFDLGDEFEIAVADLLRQVLPTRAGVCRGFIVTQHDQISAGDDIIVYDRVRFPTLRLLGDNLALKEHVPLEAVLACVEAKHTLYLEEPEAHGQSLAKACAQLRSLHELPARAPVTARDLTPHLSLHPTQPIWPRPGFFDERNPLYCAVFARHFAFSKTERRAPTVADMNRITSAVLRMRETGTMPSVVAAGEVLFIPTFRQNEQLEVRPVVGPPGVDHHGSLITGGSVGLAIMHLLSAIEQFELGRVRWDDMLGEAEAALRRRE